MSRDPLAAVGGLNGLLADEVESYGRAIAERDLARDAAVCLEQELAATEAENKKLHELFRHFRRMVLDADVQAEFSGLEFVSDYDARYRTPDGWLKS